MQIDRFFVSLKQNMDFIRKEFLIKVSKIKLHNNPSTGSRVNICGQTDGHADCNMHFMRFM